MNIGLVIQQFDPRLGGAEQWTWQFARSLLAVGHEVHVLAERFAATPTCLSPDNDARLPTARGALPRFTEHRIASSGSRLGFAAAVEDKLRELRLDVVHDMGAGWSCDLFQPHGGSRLASARQNLLLAPAWARSWKRMATQFLPRYREFSRLMARQYANDGRLFLALSQMVADDFVRLHHIDPSRIRLVYNGVDLNRFHPGRRATQREPLRQRFGLGDEILLLIVAHNFALKGVPTLIRALGRLRRAGAPLRLAIAGGKQVAPARRLATHCGVEDYVSFLGSVADAAPLYAAADIYIQPTFYDPCSLVVLEALASGLPVITSRFNGAGELLTPGLEGFLLNDPGDPQKLVDCIVPLLDRSKREQAGLAARRLAESHSLDRNRDEILALYRELAPRRRAA